MEGEIVQGELGHVSKYDLSFKDGKLVASIELDASHVLDALAAAIPGKVDDAVIGVIKAALLGK